MPGTAKVPSTPSGQEKTASVVVGACVVVVVVAWVVVVVGAAVAIETEIKIIVKLNFSQKILTAARSFVSRDASASLRIKDAGSRTTLQVNNVRNRPLRMI